MAVVGATAGVASEAGMRRRLHGENVALHFDGGLYNQIAKAETLGRVRTVFIWGRVSTYRQVYEGASSG